MKFRVGERVKVARNCENSWLYWRSEPHTQRVGEIGIIVRIDDEGDYQVEFDTEIGFSGKHFFPGDALDLVPAEKTKCKCNLSMGCTCGAFEQEMLDKGMVYNHYLRCWQEPKR